MSYFVYNGRSSEEFGLRIESKNIFSAPEFDAEFTSIPGRSGHTPPPRPLLPGYGVESAQAKRKTPQLADFSVFESFPAIHQWT